MIPVQQKINPGICRATETGWETGQFNRKGDGSLLRTVLVFINIASASIILTFPGLPISLSEFQD